jgi:hypothetical protein
VIVYQRVFTGSGVTGFDAARGATLDSNLRETHPAGAVPGTIGALTRVHGTVDCGNQNVGTSTVTVTGKTGLGTLTGPLESVRVACFVSGDDNYVVIRGIGKVGTKRAEVFVNRSPRSSSWASSRLVANASRSPATRTPLRCRPTSRT